MTIFDFEEYKKFVNTRIRDYPAAGRGIFKKMAEAIKVPRSTLSQVFHGDRDLTFEQAIDVAGFFELPALETDFFMAQVERSRAGNARLRAFAERKISNLREKARAVKAPARASLSEKARAAYFSDWYYGGVLLASSLPGLQTVPEIAAYLGLPLGRAKAVMDFLVQHGLCVADKNGFRPGPGALQLASDDPLAFRHHQNWRLSAVRRMQEYPFLEDDELCATIPCTLDRDTMLAIRKLLAEAVSKAAILAENAEADEHLAFLNIDFLRVRARH